METFRYIPDTQLASFATTYLEGGRKNWDVPHTRAVVYYATSIAACEGLDMKVPRSVAWLHDIGYYGQFTSLDSTNISDVSDRKAAHMINGERMAREFLNQPEIKSHYTPDQIDVICHLVSVHDQLNRLRTREEIAFMEADTLGAIDTKRVKPSFNKSGGDLYIRRDLYGKRLPRFQTATGIHFAKHLLPAFLNYFARLEN